MNDQKKLKVAFIGIGWIGLNRMEALVNSGLIDTKAVVDISEESIKQAQKIAPGAKVFSSIDQLTEVELDAVVIATPSGQHYGQVMAALDSGYHVFCQKPLGRTKYEIETIVKEAKRKNRVLWADMSYRYTKAMQTIKGEIDKGVIGKVYALEGVFHNAYGPDKAWFYDPQQSGGGCVIDLGIHLIDLALWVTNFPKIENLTSNLYANGKRIAGRHEGIEDYACAQMNSSNGVVVNLACSWNLSAGKDAIIKFTVYGTEGALSMENHNGSFYQFKAYHLKKRYTNELCHEDGTWGGMAICDWAEMALTSGIYHSRSEQLVKVADVIDFIYDRSK